MVRTRIAPSPTGADIHIGNLYTALINWTYARKNNGQFIIRIEDTDRTRYVEGAEKQIITTLKRFGIESDEPIQRQSDHRKIYQEAAKKLVEKGHAYYCFCTPQRLSDLRAHQQAKKMQPKYDRHCMQLSPIEINSLLEKGTLYVIRLKIPNGTTTFTDVVRGTITVSNDTIDDQVLLKSDGYPTYHLGVVVDDHRMKISHIIRAEEWISSTPKHVILYNALEWELPVFVHVPILRNPDKSKLSKRKNPVWSSWYLDQGYLPEAVCNFLSLMGWSHPDGKEIFSRDEFISVFDIKDLQAVGPVFDTKKLTWMNGEYIRAMTQEELAHRLSSFFGTTYSSELIRQTVPLVQERIKTLREYNDYCEFFLSPPHDYAIAMPPHRETLMEVKQALEGAVWDDSIGQTLEKVALSLNMKNREFFTVLRVAITGKQISPPLNESMLILGKKECISRINLAIAAP